MFESLGRRYVSSKVRVWASRLFGAALVIAAIITLVLAWSQSQIGG